MTAINGPIGLNTVGAVDETLLTATSSAAVATTPASPTAAARRLPYAATA
jgi:hypothetical protein